MHIVSASRDGASRPSSTSRTMHKFALRFLLTSLIAQRGSKRIDGVQLAASLLTLLVIALVGLYMWSHGQY